MGRNACNANQTYLDKICMFCIANRDHGVHLFNQLLLFIVVEIHVPFGQSRFARTILYQNKTNLKNRFNWLIALLDSIARSLTILYLEFLSLLFAIIFRWIT